MKKRMRRSYYKNRKKRAKAKKKSKSKSCRCKSRRSMFGSGSGAQFINLRSMMGDYGSPAMMNTYQEYLGTPSQQRSMHYNNIPSDLRSNFYT